MGYRRDHAAMVLYRKEPVVIGGYDYGSGNSAEIFEAAEGKWTQTEKMPTPSLYGHSALVVNDRIYTFGGMDFWIG